MSLHGKKELGKKERKGWHCDKILVHLKEFAPINVHDWLYFQTWPTWEMHLVVDRCA
jgi:hypothetical protein